MGRKDARPEFITITVWPRQDQKANELMDSDNLNGPSCVQEVQKCSGMQFAHHPEILPIHTATSMPAVPQPRLAQPRGLN